MTELSININEGNPRRHCGDCQLCCKLLPMQVNSEARHPHAIAAMSAVGMAKPGIRDFDKPAGERCPHQRHHKGCAVYERRPFGCQIWSCRWLVNDDCADLRRPDRAGYVIDMMPDFVTMVDNETGVKRNIQVVVIWADQRRPQAWREDEALLAYLDRRGKEGIATMVRFNSKEATTVLPPSMTDNEQWFEWPGSQAQSTPQHHDEALIDGLAACRPFKVAVGS